MASIANLLIQVSAQGANAAKQDLSGLETQAGKTETATKSLTDRITLMNARLGGIKTESQGAVASLDGLGGGFSSLAAKVGAALSVTAAFYKLIKEGREFDVLNAGLQTATGSAQGAKEAFEALQDFAMATPYSLKETTEAFTKLVNYGLEPSERALKSYGNTASGLGKPLKQMVEAVADATTGEFERLKEFGIRAKKEGDQVTFTFRGVETTVKNSTANIEQYLIQLGENNFGDSMANRMATLDGALSNLGDQWDSVFRNIMQGDMGQLIKEGVDIATKALEELNAMLASGEMAHYIRAIGAAFGPVGEDLLALKELWVKTHSDMRNTDDETLKSILDGWKNLVPNVRALIQIITVEFAHEMEGIRITWNGIVDAISGGGMAALKKARELNAANDANYKDSITGIIDKRNENVKAIDAEIQRAKMAREAWRQEAMARQALNQGSDRLAKFRAPGDPNKVTGKEKKEKKEPKSELEKAQERLDELIQRVALQDDQAQIKAFQSLKDSLRTQEEAIQASYDKRKQIILANTEAGSQEQQTLMSRLNDETAKKMEQAHDQARGPTDAIAQQLMTEEEKIRASYDNRKKIILESTAITEEERSALMVKIGEDRQKQLDNLENARMSALLSGASQGFDALAGLAKQYAGEQSGIYRAMFAVSKAFAIADAIVKIQQGIAAASAMPWPANLAAIASTIAATGSVISTISSANFSGAYDQGGNIPAGKIGLVGEFGPELVRGPANVTSRRDTADAFRSAQDSGQGSQAPAPVVNLRNINVLDPKIVGDFMATDAGEQLVMNVVQRNKAALGY